MTTLHTSFLLAYHGCSENIGNRLLSGEAKPIRSEKDYDWLGPGFYVWESDYDRAQEWANQKRIRSPQFKPFVIGVILDLGNCLDLTNRQDLPILQEAYDGLKQVLEKNKTPVPQNIDLKTDKNRDKLLRNLDCAVIRYLHDTLDEDKPHKYYYDTVRGLFQKGGELYPGSTFREKTHSQIAIRNLNCIKGFFLPLTARPTLRVKLSALLQDQR